MVILLLAQLIGFHVFLKFKGLTTYDFIIKRRVQPASPSPVQNSTHIKLNPTDIRRDEDKEKSQPVDEIKDPEPPIDVPPESLSDPRSMGTTIGVGAFPKNDSEIEMLRHPLSHQLTQRADPANSKDTIIKSKQRRSGSESKTSK